MTTPTAVQVRDPKLDPQVGDVIRKVLGKGVRTRTVTRRDGNDIFYADNTGKANRCWISSWIEWARLCTLEGAEANTPAMRAKKVVLDRIAELPKQLLDDPRPVVTKEELRNAILNETVTEADAIRAFRSAFRRLRDSVAAA